MLHEGHRLAQGRLVACLRHALCHGDIPLVDRQHATLARLLDQGGDMLVLERWPLHGIHDQHGNVGIVDGTLGTEEAEALHGVVDAVGMAHAGRVDEEIVAGTRAGADGEGDLDAVARRAGNLRDDHPLAAQDAVDVGRLAGIRTPDHRHPERLIRRGSFAGGQGFRYLVQQRGYPAAMDCGDRIEREAQRREVRQDGLVLRQIALVDRNAAGDTRAADHLRHLLIERVQAGLAIHHENRGGGFRQRRLDLFDDPRLDKILRPFAAGQAHTTGVDKVEGGRFPGYPADDPVARDAALVMHDRHAPPRDTVEESRLADVGTAYHSHNPSAPGRGSGGGKGGILIVWSRWQHAL